MNELNAPLQILSYNKTCRLYSIPAEVWKTEIFNQELLSFRNNYIIRILSKNSEKTVSCLFPKKGDLTNPFNYRDITLSAFAAKIHVSSK